MKKRNYQFLDFKGKSVETGEWVFGTPIKTKSGDVYMVNDELEQILVHDKTICQRTNSTDKNGTVIYECDLIATEPSRISKTQSFGIVLFGEEPGYLNSVVNAWRIHWTEYGPKSNYEIIGNVHDSDFQNIDWLKEKFPKYWETIYYFVKSEYEDE